MRGEADPHSPSDESTPFQIYRVADDVSGSRLALGAGRGIGRDVRCGPEPGRVGALARLNGYALEGDILEVLFGVLDGLDRDRGVLLPRLGHGPDGIPHEHGAM